MNKFPPFLYEKLQRSRLLRVWIQAAELIAMQEEHVQQETGVTWIVLRSRWPKALAVVCQRRRMDRKDDQVVVPCQHEDQRPSRLLECNGNRSAAESQSKLRGP